jgi:hypothetical protein
MLQRKSYPPAITVNGYGSEEDDDEEYEKVSKPNRRKSIKKVLSDEDNRYTMYPISINIDDEMQFQVMRMRKYVGESLAFQEGDILTLYYQSELYTVQVRSFKPSQLCGAGDIASGTLSIDFAHDLYNALSDMS